MTEIHIQTFVAAPPAQVWAAVLAHDHLLFDGLPADAWPEPHDEHAPFHRRVAWPWTPEPTEVSVTLHQVGGGTRVDLRHTGWGEGPAWDDAIQGHFAGWLQGFAALGLLIETGKDARVEDPALRGRERYFASGEIPAAAAPVYRSLTDAAVLGRWSGGVLDGAEPVDSFEDRLVRWRLRSGGELVMVLRPTPRGTHVALAEYGVRDRSASARWPPLLERLARFLA